MNNDAIIYEARKAIEQEKMALDALAGSLDDVLTQTVQFLVNVERVVVTGVGKSGHIARKIAATMASLGKPSQFIHATEASHGDFGMLTPKSAIIALSWSGQTREIVEVAFYAKSHNIPLIAMTSNKESPLARMAQFPFILPAVEELGSVGLAPTVSTMLQLVLGDLLAISVSRLMGFTQGQFKQFHPAGSLGASLRVASDVMYKGDLPLLGVQETMAQALACMARCRFWCLGVVNESGALIGMLTDAQIERCMQHLQEPVSSFLLTSFQTVEGGMSIKDVFQTMQQNQLHAIFVVEEGRPVGIISIHDLFKYGLKA